jgi:CheY-like chemotaxis protein
MSYGRKKTVMICDDEQDLLQVFELALEPKYNVILASSGEDCIDRFLEGLGHFRIPVNIILHL